MKGKKESSPGRNEYAKRAAPARDPVDQVPELAAPSVSAAGANSSTPGGGQGRVDLTGTMPEVRVDPDITEGHPGYEESGSSEMKLANAEKGGANMAQRNKSRDGTGAATQSKETEGRNMPARQVRQEQGAGTMAHRSEHPLRRLHDEIDSIFNHFFGGGLGLAQWGAGMGRLWGMDVEDADNEIHVRAEAPGFEPKDFDIQINGNMLTVRAEHQQEDEQNERGMHSWQRSYGHFQRAIALSGPVDADKVEAHYRNGVLELRLPRTEQAERKRIEVKA
jgi:HSP20 family protein